MADLTPIIKNFPEVGEVQEIKGKTLVALVCSLTNLKEALLCEVLVAVSACWVVCDFRCHEKDPVCRAWIRRWSPYPCSQGSGPIR